MKPIRLAFVFALVLASRASIVAQAPSTHVIDSPGGHWSVKVPLEWSAVMQEPDDRFAESVRLVGTGETKAWVTIQVYRANPAFDELIRDLKLSFALHKVELENQAKSTINGKPGFRFEELQTTARKRMRSRHAVIDAGSRKVLVTSALPEAPSPSADPQVLAVIKNLAQAARAFEEMLLSLDIHEPPAAPRPLELEPKEFAEDGLSMDVPRNGLLEREESGFTYSRDDLGLSLQATWQRTRLTPAEFAAFDMEESRKEEPTGARIQVAEKKDSQVGGKPAVRVRGYGLAGSLRVRTITAAYVATGPDEVLTLTYTRLGEHAFDALAALEQAVERARPSNRFAPALTKPPALTAKTEVWQGVAAAHLPEGWTGAPLPLAEGWLDSRSWSATKANDLGVRFDVTPSGKLEFEAWLHDRVVPARFGVKLSPARPIGVGGVTGNAWDLDYGPAGDRWRINVVAVFARDRAYSILTRCPVRLDETYGRLAEKIAETVVWKSQ